MIVLMTKGTRDESYYYSSINKERKMKKQLSKGYKQSENLVSGDQERLKMKVESEAPVIYVDHRELNLELPGL